jgi:hypothetical protein
MLIVREIKFVLKSMDNVKILTQKKRILQSVKLKKIMTKQLHLHHHHPFKKLLLLQNQIPVPIFQNIY